MCVISLLSTPRARNLPSPTLNVNEYNLDMSVSNAVTMRAHLTSPVSLNVRGSYIRKITEDFIVPLKNLTLLTKIGEGRYNMYRKHSANCILRICTGEFGIVYKAKFSGFGRINEVVAVKTLKGAENLGSTSAPNFSLHFRYLQSRRSG